jgi:hypothetical protein
MHGLLGGSTLGGGLLGLGHPYPVHGALTPGGGGAGAMAGVLTGGLRTRRLIRRGGGGEGHFLPAHGLVWALREATSEAVSASSPSATGSVSA